MVGRDSPGVITGKPISVGGSLGRDAATGRGALFALDRIAHAKGWTREKIRIAVEGYGNAGSWFSILAFQLGYRVVAVSDSKGAIYNPEGLDPRSVLDHKRDSGSVVDFRGRRHIDGPDIMGVDCEVLIPAALEETLRADNADWSRPTSWWRSRTIRSRPRPTRRSTRGASRSSRISSAAPAA